MERAGPDPLQGTEGKRHLQPIEKNLCLIEILPLGLASSQAPRSFPCLYNGPANLRFGDFK